MGGGILFRCCIKKIVLSSCDASNISKITIAFKKEKVNFFQNFRFPLFFYGVFDQIYTFIFKGVHEMYI